MVSHPELLNAILKEPRDDDLRLVWADWCEERGLSAYAELVRVQIALETVQSCRLITYADAIENCQCQCCQLLTQQHGLLFLPEVLEMVTPIVPDYMVGVRRIHKGFAREVSCHADAWWLHGEQMLQQQPIQQVYCNKPLTVMHEWLDSPSQRWHHLRSSLSVDQRKIVTGILTYQSPELIVERHNVEKFHEDMKKMFPTITFLTGYPNATGFEL